MQMCREKQSVKNFILHASSLAVLLTIIFVVLATKVATAELEKSPKIETRFEQIAELNGSEMLAEVRKLLAQGGWDKWHGKIYEFSRENKDGTFAAQHKEMFDTWLGGKDFLAVDAIWVRQMYEPKISAVLGKCNSLGWIKSDAGKYKDSRHVLDFSSLGPFALYPLDHSSNENMPKGMAIFITFNIYNGFMRELTAGNPIALGRRMGASALLFDLKSCSYSHLANLGSGRFGGYWEDSQQRLTGVAYYRDNVAIYDLYETEIKGHLIATLSVLNPASKKIERHFLNLRNFD